MNSYAHLIRSACCTRSSAHTHSLINFNFYCHFQAILIHLFFDASRKVLNSKLMLLMIHCIIVCARGVCVCVTIIILQRELKGEQLYLILTNVSDRRASCKYSQRIFFAAATIFWEKGWSALEKIALFNAFL